MPTYDYECKACEAKVEIFHGIKEPAKRTCPECGELALTRLIGTGGGILFKGSGFYQTDYRSESYKAGEKAAKKQAAGSSDKKKNKKETTT